ncbi:hypothetical protein BC827DRAFT_1301621 [Russula dissimulans]|nr:hypothetical protein BC827DRAFT_1301621 [Russula dissimulans]
MLDQEPFSESYLSRCVMGDSSTPQRDPAAVLAPISPPITPNISTLSSPSSNRDPTGDLSDPSFIHVDVLHHPIPSASHHVPATSPDLAMASRIQGNTDISAISGTANPITRSICGDPPLGKFDETKIVPSSVASFSTDTCPDANSQPCSDSGYSPFIDSSLASTVTRTECIMRHRVIPHIIGTPSESSPLPRRLSPPLESAVSYEHAAQRVRTIGAHNETQGPNSSLMEVSRHPREVELSESDTATNPV